MYKSCNSYEHMTSTIEWPNDNINSTKREIFAINNIYSKIENDEIIPKGVISIWTGYADKIPSGWYLCNGQTIKGVKLPDLRGKFIRGQGPNNPVGSKGGKEKIKLEIKHLPKHNHNHKHENDHKHKLKIRKGNQHASHNHFGDWDKHGYSKSLNRYHQSARPTLLAFQPRSAGFNIAKSDFISKSLNNTTKQDNLYTDEDNTEFGLSEERENRPPYLVMAYIMRL